MQRFGKSALGDRELEARLRAERPRPSAELIEGLVGERPRPRARGGLTLRLGLAAALTGVLATAGMTAGGGDPIAAFKEAAQVAKGGSGNSHGNGLGSGGKSSQGNRKGGGGQGNAGNGKPGDDQYGDKITICHRGNSPNNPGQTLTLPRQAAEAHLREHRYDTRGPCPAPLPQKVTICHRGSANAKGQTLTLPRQAADQHLRNHRYDRRGPCPK
jgi:hypothetical protein